MKSLVWVSIREIENQTASVDLLTPVVLGHWETPGEQMAQSGSVALPSSFHPSQAPRHCSGARMNIGWLQRTVIPGEAGGIAGLERPGLIRQGL